MTVFKEGAEKRMDNTTIHYLKLEYDGFYVKMNRGDRQGTISICVSCVPETKSFLIENNGSVLRQMDQRKKKEQREKTSPEYPLIKCNQRAKQLS